MLLRALTLESDGATTLSWWPVGSAISHRIYLAGDPTSFGGFEVVTGEDASPSDTAFDDRSPSPAGSFTCWLVTAVGYKGEGELGRFGG